MYYMFSIQLTNCIWCLSHLFLLLLQSTPPPLGQCAGGTHPTGMHSCWIKNQSIGVAESALHDIFWIFEHIISELFSPYFSDINLVAHIYINGYFKC